MNVSHLKYLCEQINSKFIQCKKEIKTQLNKTVITSIWDANLPTRIGCLLGLASFLSFSRIDEQAMVKVSKSDRPIHPKSLSCQEAGDKSTKHPL